MSGSSKPAAGEAVSATSTSEGQTDWAKLADEFESAPRHIERLASIAFADLVDELHREGDDKGPLSVWTIPDHTRRDVVALLRAIEDVAARARESAR